MQFKVTLNKIIACFFFFKTMAQNNTNKGFRNLMYIYVMLSSPLGLMNLIALEKVVEA